MGCCPLAEHASFDPAWPPELNEINHGPLTIPLSEFRNSLVVLDHAVLAAKPQAARNIE